MTSDKRRSVRRPSAASPRIAKLEPDSGVQLDLDDARLRQLWRRVNEDAGRQDQRAAEDAHDQGTLLNEIAQLSFHRTTDEVAAEFFLGAEAARERMAIAKATTRLMAGFYGLERLRLGLRLMTHFGLRSLDQLETVELPVRYPDGTAVRFPAPREWLERALAAIENA